MEPSSSSSSKIEVQGTTRLEGGTLTCPYCGGLPELLRIAKVRQITAFACPTCLQRLELIVPDLRPFILASLTLSILAARAAGVRGVTLIVVALLLSLPIFAVESSLFSLFARLRV